MIWRKTATVTNDAYKRWLRAQRPAWAWFFALTELEQEQLAIMGDEHVQDVIISQGYANQDPALADASLGAAQGEARGEEVLAQRMVDGLAASILARRTPPVDVPPVKRAGETMAGFGERQQANAAPKRRPQLFGQVADEAAE